MNRIYLLSPTKFDETISNPTIQIQFLDPEIDFSEIDTLIFTSKNGVEAVNRISEDWKKYPAVAVGKKTKKAVLKFGGKILATSSGNGESLEKLILEKFKDKKFLYFRPQKVAREIGKNLQNFGVFKKEEIVYQTVCKKSNAIEKNSFIIATSPLSVKCLFKNSEVPNDAIFIAIGETTKKAIPDHFQIFVANEQSLESCFKLYKKISK
ncbi:uroporphyrinogen-III synthase [Thiovulum sp. ES]|nr:uroporphyrinogen-III synthase [Thiovulum sp. ES]